MAGKPPAFQFYPKDWLSDAKVRSMTHQQRGIYIDLIAHCWIEGSIPSDWDELSHLLGVSRGDLEPLWEPIRKCFKKSRKKGRMVQPRVERERNAQRVRRSKRVESGKMGADKRWKDNKLNSTPKKVPMAKHSSSSSSSSSSASSKRIKTPHTPHPGLNGFEEFYQHYPKKTGRLEAEKAWKKISPGKELSAIIKSAIKNQVKAEHFLGSDGNQYYKNPATWLNQGCWMDAVVHRKTEEDIRLEKKAEQDRRYEA